ncbi:MAG: tetraacyldisaccharide 4'-kinase [Bacteriovoracia bacterium]
MFEQSKQSSQLASLVASLPWATVNLVARQLWPSHRFGAPVISIGNLVAGGVGKSELVAKIAKHLSEKKILVCSRGYRSKWEHQGVCSSSYAEGVSLELPDELLVVLKKAVGVHVVAGKDRVKALKRYWNEIEPDVVLLDDGFQHFAIHRDLDILVHDFSVPFLVYRDFPILFKKAALRVSFSEVPQEWKHLPWVRARYCLKGIYRKNELIEKPHQAMALCGIGNPGRFKKFLNENGIEVTKWMTFKDHQTYEHETVKKITKQIENSSSGLCLTTLKDYVKLEPVLQAKQPELLEKICWVDIDIEFLENEQIFWKVIDDVVAIRTA